MSQMDKLYDKMENKLPRRNSRNALAKYGPGPSEEDIRQNRREMMGNWEKKVDELYGPDVAD